MWAAILNIYFLIIYFFFLYLGICNKYKIGVIPIHLQKWKYTLRFFQLRTKKKNNHLNKSCCVL